jgi:hypothetical protein
MSKTIYRTSIFLYVLLLTTACLAKFSRKEASFFKLMPLSEMNTVIRFWRPRPSEVFNVGDSVDLTLENFSKDKIKFPTDYGVRIFSFNRSDGQWSEIVNGMKYFPPGNPQISPKGPDSPGVIGIGLWPLLENKGASIDLRVVVVGNVEKDGVLTEEQVGAYIDLTLQP